MAADSATAWHSEHAALFDDRYQKSPRFVERFAIWKALIDKYSPPGGEGTGLDIGCGSGVFTACLAQKNKRVVGIDGSEPMLAIGRERTQKLGLRNIEFLNRDINALDRTLDEKAHIITCSSVLEYLDDLDRSVGSLASRLNPGGVLIFSLPNRSSLYRKWEALFFLLTGRPGYYKFVRHVCVMEETQALARRLGLEVLESAYYAKTPLLSDALRAIGLRRYCDNLFLLVVRKPR